jgi:hypothetical protein
MRVQRAVLGGLGALALGVLGSSVPASAAGANTEHFLAVQTSVAHKVPLAATGPIHALGTDTPLGRTKDRFAFPKGALIIVHHRTSRQQTFDRTTCTARFTEQGTYRVSSGTGAYAHATGHGTYSVHGIFIGCDQHKPPLAISVVINAAGPLTY